MKGRDCVPINLYLRHGNVNFVSFSDVMKYYFFVCFFNHLNRYMSFLALSHTGTGWRGGGGREAGPCSVQQRTIVPFFKSVRFVGSGPGVLF